MFVHAAVASFQRWGMYIYYSDGRGGFTGGSATFRLAADTPESLALGDVKKDGHPDFVVNGHGGRGNQANGPDVYLGDDLDFEVAEESTTSRQGPSLMLGPFVFYDSKLVVRTSLNQERSLSQ
jgi:hypothetical protein